MITQVYYQAFLVSDINKVGPTKSVRIFATTVSDNRYHTRSRVRWTNHVPPTEGLLRRMNKLSRMLTRSSMFPSGVNVKCKAEINAFINKLRSEVEYHERYDQD